MRIADIKKGKKYYNIVALNRTHKPTGKKKRQLLTMYVVEVDIDRLRVCASLNGFPAKWYKSHEVANWVTEKPQDCGCTTGTVENFVVCEKHSVKIKKK